MIINLKDTRTKTEVTFKDATADTGAKETIVDVKVMEDHTIAGDVRITH
jgi:hypothetical protein